jgi:hypothetical protein
MPWFDLFGGHLIEALDKVRQTSACYEGYLIVVKKVALIFLTQLFLW